MSFWKPTPSRVYADAAAATPLLPAARAELVRLLPLFGNPGALHREGVAAREELERARRAVAVAIGAHPDEIIFTGSGTEANNLALTGALRNAAHVLTTNIEHASVLEPLRHSGARVAELGVSAEGVLDLEEFKEALAADTSLVSVQLVNSEVGSVQPVREIAKLLRKQGRKVLLHTDASQAPLWMDLKVERLGVDLMTLDAQKVGGGKGVGALYIRRGTDIEPLLWGGGQERGMRSGTENVPAIGAFAAALAEAQAGAASRATRVAEVRDFLWREMRRLIPDAILNGPALERRVANNINASIPGLEAQMAVISMDALGVAVSTRSACSAGEEEPSHVIKALGTPPELAGTAVRITLLPDATQRDASRIAATLRESAQRYRKK